MSVSAEGNYTTPTRSREARARLADPDSLTVSGTRLLNISLEPANALASLTIPALSASQEERPPSQLPLVGA